MGRLAWKIASFGSNSKEIEFEKKTEHVNTHTVLANLIQFPL